MKITTIKHVEEIPYIIVMIRQIGMYNFPKAIICGDVSELEEHAKSIMGYDDVTHIKIINQSKEKIIYNMNELNCYLELEKKYHEDYDKKDLDILEKIYDLSRQINRRSSDVGLLSHLLQESIENFRKIVKEKK